MTSRTWQLSLCVLGALLLGHALLRPSISEAQTNITPSGLGTALNGSTITGCTGGTCEITGGTPIGSNLFHSFGLFNIAGGDVANFNHGPGTANILGRVTGGQVSNIFGTIQTTGAPGAGIANLFLINPAGWVFGPGAALNVTGSFHVSTADFIRLGALADGVQFNASGAGDALLTSAAPTAFGFLGPTVAPISVSLEGSLPGLAVPEGKTLSFVGGDISITGSTLSAPSGRVQIAGVASAGEVTIPDLDVSSFSSLGQVTIAADAFGTPSVLDTAGVPVVDPDFLNVIGGGVGGEVVIRGGRLVVSGSFLQTGGYGDLSGGTPKIDVAVTDSITLDASVLDASGKPISDSGGNVIGGGAGGEVIIRGGSLVANGSTLQTGGYGDLSGGTPKIDVAVTDSIALDASLLDASGKPIFDIDFNLIGGGAGGAVIIRGGSLFASGSTLQAGNYGSSNGATPGIDIAVSNDVTLAGSALFAFTQGAGDGGALRINAGSLVMQGGSGINTFTFGAGRGGDIAIEAGSVMLTEGSSVVSSTSGSGAGGDVNVSASSADSFVMSGDSSISTVTDVGSTGAGGKILLSSPSMSVDGGAFVNSLSFGAGAGGDLVVQVGDLSIQGGALLKSETSGAPGGNIFVTATGSATISGANSGIFSGGSGAVEGVQAGDISVTARQLTVTAGGVIQNGNALDRAGGISVAAIDSIVISGGGKILSQAFADDVGDVTVSAPSGSLVMDAGFIQTSTTQQGNAGNIVVDVATLSLANGAQIVTSSIGTAAGLGGDLIISAATSVSISGSSSGLFSTASFQDVDPAAGGGGLISVLTPMLTTGDGAKVSAVTPGAGLAGSISLNATTLSVASGAQVTAATTSTGNAGTIAMTGGQISVSGPNTIVSTTTSSAGQGGDITLTGQHVDILAGGRVTAEASGTGAAGSVTITATGANTLTISGAGSTVSTSTLGDGDGGNVILASAGDVHISDGGSVTADSLGGTGDTGTINITAGSSIIMDNGTISTRAVTSDGGDIKLDAPDVVQLSDSKITTSVESGVGIGGNINIDPQFVILNNSTIIANAFGGPGGNITIIADNFLQSANSVIQASSALSTPGTIQIQSPDNNVESSIAQLPAAFLDASALLRGLCTARRTGAASSFVVAGRGGLPVDADGYLPSFGTDAAAGMAGADVPARADARHLDGRRFALMLAMADYQDCSR
jgi:filamentous hemagglutinin family protein